jgi:hypothetical protein
MHVVNRNKDAGDRYKRLLDVVTKVDVAYESTGISTFVGDYVASRV